jgi:HPt (histidine-containing phosphotransfer) domain-containing protein
LLTRYLELPRIAFADIEAASSKADINAVTAQAHKLKSASRSVGALPLGDLCDHIESSGMAQDANTCLELAHTLPTAFAPVQECIQAHLSRQRA